MVLTLFRLGRFGRMTPLGLALTGYRVWRRLSPQQKAAIRRRVRGVTGRARRGGSAREPVTAATMSRVGSATAPDEEIAPSGR